MTAPTPPDATPQLHPRVEAFKWRYEVYDPDLAPVLPAVKRFISDALNHGEKRWLSLLGPSGVGKTFVLKQGFAVIERAVSFGKWQFTVPSGFRGARIAHIKPAVDLDDYKAAKHYGGYDFLYIEDIGSGADAGAGSGKVVKSRLMELLDLRTGKWTMMDANLYRADIERDLDGRIASRLKRDGSTCIEIPQTVPDFWR